MGWSQVGAKAAAGWEASRREGGFSASAQGPPSSQVPPDPCQHLQASLSEPQRLVG